MLHSDDDIALFMSCTDITVGFDNFFQRKAPIYSRFYLPGLNQLFESKQVFYLFFGPG